jgi:D-methionine transport system substrate-binding protein
MIKYLMPLLIPVLMLSSCSSSKNGFKVAATAVPHAELLEVIKPDLKAEGIDLIIIVTDDYNMPNRALAHHEIEANFFQHTPFMEEQIKQFGYQLEKLCSVELEPMGIYSKKITSLAELKNRATIALPNDPTNESRALNLLQDQGLIQLDRAHNLQATILNIKNNPKELKFIEVDAAMLARTLDDVDLSIINTNYALQAGLSPLKEALVLEKPDSPYANIIAIRAGEQNKKQIEALKAAMNSEKMREFILKKYQGAIIPSF